jgi:5-methylcytosine-specific restriction endonuclease McrA
MTRNDPFGVFAGRSSGSIWGDSPKNNTRKPIGKPLRDQVWLMYMKNKPEGKCYCCRMRSIHFTDFQVGHNKAVAKGGKDNISNLRPICGPCNRGMGTKSIEWYRKKYFAKPTKRKSKKSKKTRNSDTSFGFGDVRIKPFRL